MRIAISICILLGFINSCFPSQQPIYFHFRSEESMPPQQLVRVLKDSKNVITAPLRWDKRDLGAAGLIVAGTLGLMTVDQLITDRLTTAASPLMHSLLSVTDKFGYENTAIPILIGAYALGECIQNPKMRKIAMLSMESFLFAGGCTSIGKYLVHRQRPRSKNASAFHYDGPSLKPNHVSFPSGHTACAFAVAAVIAGEFKEQSPFIPLAAYSLAALTGLARIERKDHWASDVFFGACLGMSIGKLLVKLHADNLLSRDWKIGILSDDEGLQMHLGHSF